MGQPTAFWAPVHRVLQRQPPSAAGIVSPYAAPSVDFLGNGVQDHRLPYDLLNGSAAAPAVLAHFGRTVMALNITPAALGTAKIAALANVVSGTAMTLAAASTGITVVPAGGLLVLPSLNVVPANALVLDGNPALKSFGRKGNAGFYDRTSLTARAVSITAAASATGGHFVVSGYDIYGYPMSENINAAAGAATTNGKKAFKFITSVVPQFTDAHNYSVGTTDIFGLPLRASQFADTLLHWNDALLTANTGFVVADATSPATTTTGDVRGTYAVQSASDGTKKLVARIDLSLALIQADATQGLFGVPQV